MKACLFDLDGCLYSGGQAETGTIHDVNRLIDRGTALAFVTNNSTDRPEAIRSKLQGLGFAVTDQPILTPAAHAGEFIRESYGPSRVYALGEEVLRDSLTEAGHRLVTEEQPDLVLIARHRKADFGMIQKAVWYLQNGALLVATNMDNYHPGEGGLRVLETGVLVGAIRKAIPQHPVVIGKPSPFLINKALELLRVEREEALMVGDNHFTDILGGRQAGLQTALMSSSLSDRDIFMEDYRINSIGDLEKYMDRETQKEDQVG
ncbi:MAG: HAD-IIA family hydrolase [Spirochaetales bacterium]|nr:HAD-IIA family hydrolase [Spirochaetales bacterium]